MTGKIEQNRTKIISTLGDMLAQAARASVARGAAYEPGERINIDAPDAWNAVAETIVKLVEAKVEESRAEPKDD